MEVSKSWKACHLATYDAQTMRTHECFACRHQAKTYCDSSFCAFARRRGIAKVENLGLACLTVDVQQDELGVAVQCHD